MDPALITFINDSTVIVQADNLNYLNSKTNRILDNIKKNTCLPVS